MIKKLICKIFGHKEYYAPIERGYIKRCKRCKKPITNYVDFTYIVTEVHDKSFNIRLK